MVERISRTMYTKIQITGTIEVLTGMHIGGSSAFAAIGAVDSPVIKDVITGYPMIPGSSLSQGVARKSRSRSHLFSCSVSIFYSARCSCSRAPADHPDQPKKEGDPHPCGSPFPFRHFVFNPWSAHCRTKPRFFQRRCPIICRAYILPNSSL